MKYNLIMITVDGARVDRIKQFDNFNKLINKGTFFSNVITYAPYTAASMHAIFSGAYGNKTGMDNYYGTYSFQKDCYLTLTEYLKNDGYHTMADVLNELIVPSQGFDEFNVHNELKDNLTQRDCDLLERADSFRRHKENFFLYMHYSNIHTGIMLNVLKKYNNFSQEYFDMKENNSKAYDSYLEKADSYLGKILGKIQELGMFDDTIIVIQSDHGISVGERFGERAYGAFCYDYTVKAFTFFIQPKIFPVKEVDQLVRTVDTTPTLLDVFGFEPELGYKEMDGKSMIPLVSGGSDKRYAFIEAGNPLQSGEPPKRPNVRAIRTSKWKFIRNYWNGVEELYDLESDADERNNLIDSQKVIADDLRKMLYSHVPNQGASAFVPSTYNLQPVPSNNVKKAIIIAAGKSTRMLPLTKEMPKCLLTINGKRILDHSISALNYNGINDVVIIKGYKKDKLNLPDHRYYEDDNQYGILSSLMHAENEMDEPFMATYSDILFDQAVVKKLLSTPGDIVVVVDTDWRAYYENRTDHGFEEAENVVLDGDSIIEIGKHISPEAAHGEFIGMIKCSADGAKIFKEIYREVHNNYLGKPFHKASTLEKAYLTDFIQEIIDRGYPVKAAKIQKGWAEFDTVQDYNRIQDKKVKDIIY